MFVFGFQSRIDQSLEIMKNKRSLHRWYFWEAYRLAVGRCRCYQLAPLRLARRLRSVNSVLYLIRAALTSSKQTLYRISAARISLDTISNGRLAFMKMTGDAGPPERILVYTYRKPVNGSYRTGGEKEEFRERHVP